MRIRIMTVVAAALLSVSAIGISYAGSARVLYRASWAGNMSAWAHGGGSWSVKANLLQYGGGDVTDLIAPYKATRSSYAVEAVIKLVVFKDTGLSENRGFGILLRASGPVDPAATTAGIMAGVGRGFMGCDGVTSQAVFTTADTDLQSLKKHNQSFHPGSAWHVYRAEVRGNTLKLRIDGHLQNTITTKRFAAGTNIGLFSLGGQVQVKSFKVLGL